MQEAQVSTERTGGSSDTSGSQMAKVQLTFTGTGLRTKTTQLTILLYSEQYKGTRWNDNSTNPSTENLPKSFIKQKMPNIRWSQLLKCEDVLLFCVL